MVTSACAVAIIGVAGRFPGAPNVETFWSNLLSGVESIRHFDPAEMEDGFDAATRQRPEYVRARAILDDPDLFDASFFGIHRRDAELIDPQHRLFLECCWEALEDAGYDPTTYPGAIGVYGGCSINSYFLRNVLGNSRETVERFTDDYPVGSYPELLGAGHDFLTTRVSYKLNLRGPAMTVQSACSTSLLTVAQAAQTLMLGQADMMLAGGVSISFPQKRGYLYQSGGMVSSDGHCRTFDANASGTVFGDGVGVVVLKRLDDALRDADTIYAVIRGYGINNDASDKVGYTAPSIDGQASAVRAAHAMAAFAPESVGYIECHGTATPLGDPIEIAALTRAFSGVAAENASIVLGSAKPNVGHLDVAAGITGLIKTALTVRHGVIPPTLHFTALNPHIDFEGIPFSVNVERAAWSGAGDVRRAGVSAFGVGGTNVHLALESAPAPMVRERELRPQLLVFSARSEAALAQTRRRVATYLRGLSDAQLADAAFTLALGRKKFAYRAAVVASTIDEAVHALEQPTPRKMTPVTVDPVVAFMFPGQGAQYAGMGSELYALLPTFRAAIDRCAEVLASLLGSDLRTILYPANITDASHARLRNTEIAQVALFATEFALASVWQQWGIAPAAMIGHSVGEFVAAVLAGVFTLEEALMLVHERGRLMGALPAGSMLAVRLSEADLAPYLVAPLDVAALNAPGLSVVAGPADAIDALEMELGKRDIIARRLHTSHAFHSAMMDPVVAPLTARAGAMSLRPPTIPYVSGVTGDWIAAEEATSPEYWARHCREPVRFAAGLQTIVDSGIRALIEVGPGTTLSTFARSGAARGADYLVARSLPTNEREQPDLAGLLEAAGTLWTVGAPLDLEAVFAGRPHGRIPLPSYPFERSRYWVAPNLHTPPEREIVESPIVSEPIITSNASRPERIVRELLALFEDISGENLSDADTVVTFLELGFDSLFLGRIVQHIQNRFGVTITFRQLLDGIPSIGALAEHIAREAPTLGGINESVTAAVVNVPLTSAAPAARPSTAANASIEALMRDQLTAMQGLMRDQLVALGALATTDVAAVPTFAPAPAPASIDMAPESPSRFDAFKIASGPRVETTFAQHVHIDALVAATIARTAGSKARTAAHRRVLADPRVAAGFRAEWKEMVYPITCVRAKGSRLWDIDGNEYIDLLNGFGQTAFGHSPDFVVEALTTQMADGFAIGPQTDLAGQVAELFCELTGNERVTFCNTGSEAVMAAMRVARTVTGRDKIVVFDGAYHGQFDEVLVKSARRSTRSLPVAAGIPAASVSNMTVLEYGAPASLAWIREHAHELAAVIVEPVQSRHPGLVPREFVAELREITASSGSALVFDEVVTGFRVHPGGMQAIFGIRADLATYGKVVGGGMPVGILAGNERFMDALDGGMWEYGDDSIPHVAPTFFAGTFVRHPLVMAAVLAVLRHLRAQGPALQEALTQRTERLVLRLNNVLEARGVATRIESFGSMFYLNLAREDRFAGLLFYHLRNRGLYIQEGFPSFLTTAHTDADVDAIVTAFDESLHALQSAGILSGSGTAATRNRFEIPLTESQTEIWLAAQTGDAASCAFNESVTLRLRGRLDRAALTSAWNGVVARHESLRAAFSPTGEVMSIASGRSIELTDLDASRGGLVQAERLTGERIAADAAQAFDLVAGPVMRATLVRLAPEDHALILTAHHIVCDGWSINVIIEELAALYAAAHSGTDVQLVDPLAFSAYAAQLEARDATSRSAVASYWLDEFRDDITPLDLPSDRPRPAVKTFKGATRSVNISRDVADRIRTAGARNGATLFVTLLAGFHALIGRLSDRRDVVVGVPTAGQSALEGQILVGHCVNFLPIRARWERETTVAEFLSTMKRRVLDAYEHQSYTLGTLVRALSPERSLNRVPLAEVQFNLERLASNVSLPDVAVSVEPNPKAFVNFDLFLNVVESSEGLRLDCDYSTDLFDAETIERWLAYYQTLLNSFVDDASQALSETNYITTGDLTMLAALNATSMEFPRDQCVHSLVEHQAIQRPEAVAVRFGDQTLTYEELDARANRLAHYILKRSGGTRKLIGVMLDRSLEMVVALLATLKAGCAYVPLDPTHPPARLRRILAEADIAALIVDDGHPAQLLCDARLAIDVVHDAAAIAAESASTPPAVVVSADLAYVIYTSGSTGVPKGVEIAHENVVNFLISMAQKPGFTSADTLLAITTISFDIAGLELFLPLSVGGTLIVASNDECADGFKLRDRLDTATVMQATPASWRLLLEAGFASSPRLKMLCGGEALPRELADRLLEGGGELWNMYGPTETTIWSSCVRVLPGKAPMTVGTPIANTQMYVLDEFDRTVAPGITGHLHIAGDGVARGYFNRRDLTAERFVRNPFTAGRMYRTGDLARILTSGEVQIIGRNDQQIKIRGYRVELGEIEAMLEKNAHLAAVAVRLFQGPDGDGKIVAYYVERPATPHTPQSLRASIADDLPKYMIPTVWMALDALPLSPAGKIDRAALPTPEAAEAAMPERAEVTLTATEAALSRIWAEVMRTERVGTDEDLFALGADSLQIFAITARANAQGMRLAAKELFRYPTIAALAHRLDSGNVAASGSAEMLTAKP